MSITCRELRARGMALYKGQFGFFVVIGLLFSVLAATLGATMIGSLLFGTLCLGMAYAMIRVRRGYSPNYANIFEGFSNVATTIIVWILTGIYIFLWSLLLVVPGIIATIKYSMVYYILADNPKLTATEAIKESCRLIDGYKGKYFLLQLSFIGWHILAIMTFGLGYLLLTPYIECTNLEFYHFLLEEKGVDISTSNINDNAEPTKN